MDKMFQLRLLSLWVGLLGATGCLSEMSLGDAARAPACVVNSDCDSGEICDIGYCFGNPPTGPHYAVIEPPADRPDLATTEVTDVQFTSEGTTSDLAFESAARLSGNIEIQCSNDPTADCASGPVATDATLVFSRPSKIPGMPPYRVTVSTAAGNQRGFFEVSLPESRCSDIENCEDQYEVSVIPENGGASMSLAQASPGELAPPFRTTIVLRGDTEVNWTVGNTETTKTATGCIAFASGESASGMAVSAFDSQDKRASNRAVTNEEGCYTLSINRGDTLYRLEFSSLESERPGLHVNNVSIADVSEAVLLPSHTIPLFPEAKRRRLTIFGIEGSGDRMAIPGVQLVFYAEQPGETPDATVVFSKTAETTAQSGALFGATNIELRTDINYNVVAIPPAAGEFAAVFDHEVKPAESQTALPEMQLPRRIGLEAVVKSRSGLPIATGQGTVALSPSFQSRLLRKLKPYAVDRFQSFSQPKSEIEADGSLFLWLNRDFLGEVASYDFFFSPPSNQDAPEWALEAVPVPVSDDFELGTIVLPPAAFMRGYVQTQSGTAVEGAKVRLFQPRDNPFCGLGCTSPPLSRGVFTSTGTGLTVLVAPRRLED